jgi:hypothetical protein
VSVGLFLDVSGRRVAFGEPAGRMKKCKNASCKLQFAEEWIASRAAGAAAAFQLD